VSKVAYIDKKVDGHTICGVVDDVASVDAIKIRMREYVNNVG